MTTTSFLVLLVATNHHHYQNCMFTRAALMSGQHGAHTGV